MFLTIEDNSYIGQWLQVPHWFLLLSLFQYPNFPNHYTGTLHARRNQATLLSPYSPQEMKIIWNQSPKYVCRHHNNPWFPQTQMRPHHFLVIHFSTFSGAFRSTVWYHCKQTSMSDNDGTQKQLASNSPTGEFTVAWWGWQTMLILLYLFKTQGRRHIQRFLASVGLNESILPGSQTFWGH